MALRRGALLLAAGLVTEGIYLAAVVRLPWWRYGGTLNSWSQILGRDWVPLVVCLAGVALLMAAYVGGWRVVQRAAVPAQVRGIVWAFAGGFAITLFWLMPITSDLFNYLTRAHLFTDLDANPLLVAPVDFPRDQLVWAYPTQYVTEPSVYGPAWALVTAPATVGRYDVVGGLLYLKGLAAVAYLGCVWCLEQILRRIRPESAVEGLFLFAWNPLVLLMGVGDGHNDVVMMAAVLLAIWLLLHDRWTLAFGTLALSVWIKYASVVFLPLFVIYVWWRVGERHGRDPWPVLVRGGLAAVAVTALLFAPFWRPAWIAEVAERLLWPDNWHGGSGGWSPWLVGGGLLLFAAIYGVLLWRVARARGSFRRLAEIGFEVSLLAFVLGVARSQPWHLIWPAAMAGFSNRRWAWPIVVGLSAFMLVGQIWVEWGAPGIEISP